MDRRRPARRDHLKARHLGLDRVGLCGAVGYGEEEFSELPFARQVAAHIKSDHHEVRLSREEFFASLPRLIWHEDEPIVWPSSVSLYSVARLARERVVVVLTGEGSDETLAGYTRYAWTLVNSKMDRTYRTLSPTFLRNWVRQGIAAAPLSAALHRKPLRAVPWK